MRKLTLAAAGVACVTLGGVQAMAEGLPSSKIAIMQGDLYGLGAHACADAGTVPDPDDLPPGPGACDEGLLEDTGFVNVMSSFIKTPNGKELTFDVSLQCGLVTFTQVKNVTTTGGSLTSVAEGQGRIQVRVKVTEVDNNGNEFDGGEVWYAYPQNDGTNPLAGDPPPAGDNGAAGVTFCHRFQQLSLTTRELTCTDGDDENDDAQCEVTIGLLLRTLDAHSFNYALSNLPSGPKKIEVQARATAAANIFGDTGSDGSAKGEAFVGVGSTVVETGRAVNSYDVSAGPIVEFEELQ